MVQEYLWHQPHFFQCTVGSKSICFHKAHVLTKNSTQPWHINTYQQHQNLSTTPTSMNNINSSQTIFQSWEQWMTEKHVCLPYHKGQTFLSDYLWQASSDTWQNPLDQCNLLTWPYLHIHEDVLQAPPVAPCKQIGQCKRWPPNSRWIHRTAKCNSALHLSWEYTEGEQAKVMSTRVFQANITILGSTPYLFFTDWAQMVTLWFTGHPLGTLLQLWALAKSQTTVFVGFRWL